jgi:DNA recombination protein RmuC
LLIYVFISIIFILLSVFFIVYRYKVEIKLLVEKNSDLDFKHNDLFKKNQYLNDKILKMTEDLSRFKQDLLNKDLILDEQKNIIREIKQNLLIEFENVASKIFNENSVRITSQNQYNLNLILEPLADKIKNFENKVSDVYDKENIERANLRGQIETLAALNHKMNTNAENLTKALLTDNKMQGNWGEFILESILEKTGLTKDVEYSVQSSFNDSDGNRLRPDIIINLPQNKSLIIDSKVSLSAYTKLQTAEDTEEYNNYLKEHITSIKQHIKNLANKSYQLLYNINSIDFVLLFIPIESALSVVLRQDYSIFDDALQKNIILVCPSTLLATMRTIYTLWRTERSIQNTKEIAQIGGELYDRMVNFMNEMEKISDSIKNIQKNYDNAIIKIQGNKGIIKSAFKLKDLGVKSSKILDDKYLLGNDSLIE